MLTVVGLGPGAGEQMTLEAKRALEECQVIVGYTVYVDLVKEQFPDKEFYTTPMTREVERCQWAVDQAIAGREVCMICSGDSGVYGMAGLICRMAQDLVEVRILPGITAACGGAAVLGAPLTHDFAVISLSDRLTPWEKIICRLKAAAAADFTICIYNPSSKGRPDHLKKACEVLLTEKAPDTVCGIVRNIGRDGQSSRILTLEELKEVQVDMFTTVFVGNSMTEQMWGKMVTPRGYKNE